MVYAVNLARRRSSRLSCNKTLPPACVAPHDLLHAIWQASPRNYCPKATSPLGGSSVEAINNISPACLPEIFCFTQTATIFHAPTQRSLLRAAMSVQFTCTRSRPTGTRNRHGVVSFTVAPESHGQAPSRRPAYQPSSPSARVFKHNTETTRATITFQPSSALHHHAANRAHDHLFTRHRRGHFRFDTPSQSTNHRWLNRRRTVYVRRNQPPPPPPPPSRKTFAGDRRDACTRFSCSHMRRPIELQRASSNSTPQRRPANLAPHWPLSIASSRLGQCPTPSNERPRNCRSRPLRRRTRRKRYRSDAPTRLPIAPPTTGRRMGRPLFQESQEEWRWWTPPITADTTWRGRAGAARSDRMSSSNSLAKRTTTTPTTAHETPRHRRPETENPRPRAPKSRAAAPQCPPLLLLERFTEVAI